MSLRDGTDTGVGTSEEIAESAHVMRRTAAAAILLILLFACTTSRNPAVSSPSSPTAALATPPTVLTTTHTDWPPETSRAFKLSLRVPPDWSTRWNPQRDGTLGDILDAGSWHFSRHLPECSPIPPGQALIALSEQTSGSEAGFPARPRRFETAHLRRLEVRVGCRQKAELFRFTVTGRQLYAWMMFGPDLPTGVRTKAEATLSTLRVEPTSP